MSEGASFSAVVLMIAVMSTFVLFIINNMLRNKKTKKLIKSLFLKYIFISMGVIILFSFFYFLVYMYDFQNSIDTLPKDDHELAAKMIREFPNLQGVDIDSYKSDGWIILDFLYFSASIYLQFPNDIKILGPGQFIMVFERILGTLVPLLLVGFSFTQRKNEGESGDYQLFQIYLHRGWNVIRVLHSKGIVELINEQQEELIVKRLYFSDLDEIKKEIEEFAVDWNKIDINLVPYYLKYLEETLRNISGDFKFEASELFYKRNSDKKDYYLSLYNFIEKISKDEGVLKSDIDFKDLNVIKGRIKLFLEKTYSIFLGEQNDE
ncbi:hypothetical protein [Paenibacillus sp. FSL M7-0896]|uniref:hypothetical protein n=1 Tax=Paenibacillus sp. FSL M7-0896 TaxID=2921610 RepID=UPI0030D77F26